YQAQDGIRDFHVTGVQTCALPIYPPPAPAPTGRGNPLPAAAQSITGTGRSRRPPRHGRMDPAPPPQGRSRHAISGHHPPHAPGPACALHEGYGNRTGRSRLPTRLLLTGSIPARIQTLDRRSTRAISPADETAKAGLKRVPSRASIRTRHGCSYNQYPALRFNTPERDLVLPVGAPPTVRTAIEPNLRTSPIRTRHGCSYNQYPALRFNTPERDLVLPVGAPHRCEPQSSQDSGPAAHSHPTRVLLRWIRGGDVWCRSTAPGANWAGTHSHPARCSYNKYANSHPWRLLLPREGVGCLALTAPAHHLQRHPIPGRVAPAVLLHTRSYCLLLLDHSLHGNRFNLTPLLYSQMKATRESSEAIDFATVSGLR